jgi:hypothetical protein
MLKNFMCGKRWRRRRRRRRSSFLYGCGIRLTGHNGGMNLFGGNARILRKR